MTPPVRNPTGFFEKLLELEWPGRTACVTPAPLDPIDAAPLDDPRSFEVLEIMVGPLQDDPAFVFFRVVVADQMRRHDWPGAAMIVLMEARQRFNVSARRRSACGSIMTIARKGPDSDVTVFRDERCLYCASCKLNPAGESAAGIAEELDGVREMIGHLKIHKDAGHKVPERLLRRLIAEAEGTPWDASDEDARLPKGEQAFDDTLELVALLLEPARRLLETLDAAKEAETLEEAQTAITDAVREARTVIHLAAITPVHDP